MAFLYFAVPISPSRPFLDTNGRQLPAILGTLPGSKGARDIPVYEHGIFASHLVPRYHIHGNTLNAIEWISLVNVLLDVFHCLCWNLKNTTKWAAPPQKKCDTIGDLCFLTFLQCYSILGCHQLAALVPGLSPLLQYLTASENRYDQRVS